MPFSRQTRYAGRPCIKFYVARKTPEMLAQIPATIAGHPVVIEETGEVVIEETGEFKALERGKALDR